MLLPPILGQSAGNRSSEYRLAKTLDNDRYLGKPFFDRINTGNDFVQLGDNTFLFVEGRQGEKELG